MKLTISIKTSIVNSIMADVPKIDYHQQAEKLARDFIEDKMPIQILHIAKTKDVHRLRESYFHFEAKDGRHYLNFCVKGGDNEEDMVTDEEKNQIQELLQLAYLQKIQRKTLRNKLVTAFAGINTKKQFISAFPEFEKYLPSEQEKTNNLPAIINVIGDLVEAGWSKGNGQG